MAYIGNQPTVGNFVKLDAITTSATATYNLTNGGVAYSPQSANHCIVSLNGVIQSPTTSFTISGSTIVFASALTSNDVIDFILVLGDVLNIGTPSDATVGFSKVTSNLITGATAETTIAGGDSVLIYDDSASALRKMTVANFGNTPSFRAFLSTSMTGVALSTETKITFQSESWDTDNAFDSTTNYRYTIPANKSGKYFFGSQLTFLNSANWKTNSIMLYKNGNEISRGFKIKFTSDIIDSGSYATINLQTIVDAAVSDYFEIFIEIQSASGTGTILSGSQYTSFYGFRLIGV